MPARYQHSSCNACCNPRLFIISTFAGSTSMDRLHLQIGAQHMQVHSRISSRCLVAGCRSDNQPTVRAVNPQLRSYIRSSGLAKQARTSRAKICCRAGAGMKTAIVSGTATRYGLGRGIMHALLQVCWLPLAYLLDFLCSEDSIAVSQAGWSCVGVDVNDHEAEAADPVLQNHQQKYKLLQADISDDEAVQAAMTEASAFLNNSINCLVNNAGSRSPVSQPQQYLRTSGTYSMLLILIILCCSLLPCCDRI